MTLETIIKDQVAKLNPKNKRDFQKKTIELNHIGKFLLSIDESYSIISVRESPDVILENSTCKVGLEHVTLANYILQEQEGSIYNLFKRAQSVFSNQYPETKLLINIYIKRGFPKIRKTQSEKLINDINNIIKRFIDSKTIIDNDLIEEIYYMPFTELDYEPNKGAWGSGLLTYELLNQTIQAKEKFVVKYKKNTNIDKQWLLIVIGSMGESSYQIDDSILKTFNSNFERIYILEDFNWRVTKIK